MHIDNLIKIKILSILTSFSNFLLTFFPFTGVLLLTNSPNKTNSNGSLTNNDLSPIELSEWREKVHSNGSNFIELCRFLKQSPDIWSLYEWWDWLTPKSVGHRRFDTMFYVCCLDKQPNVVVDNKEVTTLKVRAIIEYKISTIE